MSLAEEGPARSVPARMASTPAGWVAPWGWLSDTCTSHYTPRTPLAGMLPAVLLSLVWPRLVRLHLISPVRSTGCVSVLCSSFVVGHGSGGGCRSRVLAYREGGVRAGSSCGMQGLTLDWAGSKDWGCAHDTHIPRMPTHATRRHLLDLELF